MQISRHFPFISININIGVKDMIIFIIFTICNVIEA